MPAHAKLALIIPCYNEAQRLQLGALNAFLDSAPDIDLILVDDGSTDQTARLLTELAASQPGRASVLSLKTNRGKAEAIRTAVLDVLRRDACELVGYADADLAFPLEEFPHMLRRFEGNDELQMVLASRVKLMGYDIRRKPYRHYIGRVFATFASLLLDMPVYDTQCGGKVFRKEAAAVMFAEPFVSRWIFDVEMLLRLKPWLLREKGCRGEQLGRYINEMPLSRWHDVGGSKIRLRHYFQSMADYGRLLVAKTGRGRKPPA